MVADYTEIRYVKKISLFNIMKLSCLYRLKGQMNLVIIKWQHMSAKTLYDKVVKGHCVAIHHTPIQVQTSMINGRCQGQRTQCCEALFTVLAKSINFTKACIRFEESSGRWTMAC